MSSTHFVYIIHAPDRGVIKVGITKDVKQRFSTLQTASPYKLQIARTFEYQCQQHARHVEVTTHSALRMKNKSGEWFEASIAEAEDIITRCKLPPIGATASSKKKAEKPGVTADNSTELSDAILRDLVAKKTPFEEIEIDDQCIIADTIPDVTEFAWQSRIDCYDDGIVRVLYHVANPARYALLDRMIKSGEVRRQTEIVKVKTPQGLVDDEVERIIGDAQLVEDADTLAECLCELLPLWDLYNDIFDEFFALMMKQPKEDRSSDVVSGPLDLFDLACAHFIPAHWRSIAVNGGTYNDGSEFTAKAGSIVGTLRKLDPAGVIAPSVNDLTHLMGPYYYNRDREAAEQVGISLRDYRGAEHHARTVERVIHVSKKDDQRKSNRKPREAKVEAQGTLI